MIVYIVSHQSYAVHKLEKMGDDEGDDFNICYVSHLNRSNVARPNMLKDALTDNEVLVFSNLSTLNETQFNRTPIQNYINPFTPSVP